MQLVLFSYNTFLAPTNTRLALEHIRAWILVCRRHGVVDVDLDARIRCLVRARQRHLVGSWRVGAASARYGQLRARDVELGTAGAGRSVEADVLSSEEVLAGSDALWDRNAERAFACFFGSGLLESSSPPTIEFLGSSKIWGGPGGGDNALVLGHVSCWPKFGCSW